MRMLPCHSKSRRHLELVPAHAYHADAAACRCARFCRQNSSLALSDRLQLTMLLVAFSQRVEHGQVSNAVVRAYRCPSFTCFRLSFDFGSFAVLFLQEIHLLHFLAITFAFVSRSFSWSSRAGPMLVQPLVHSSPTSTCRKSPMFCIRRSGYVYLPLTSICRGRNPASRKSEAADHPGILPLAPFCTRY